MSGRETGVGASILPQGRQALPHRQGQLRRRHEAPEHDLRRVPALAARPCATSSRSIPRRRSAMPGVVAIFTGADLAADNVGGMPCALAGSRQVDGTPIKEPAHPALAQGKVRCVGDADRLRRRRDARAGARGGRGDRGRLRDAAGGRRRARRDPARRAAVFDEIPDNTCFDWECGDAKATAAAFSQGGARRPHQPRQQPPGRQPDGAARRGRRIRRRPRALHPVDDQPVPAHRQAADGQLRAPHPAAQAARRGAGRRRRLRRQAVPLCRGGDPHLGGRARSSGR